MAKIPVFGGNENVIIARPEIRVMKIDKDFDFFIIGSKFIDLGRWII